ncbi:uncharacterized protein LOC123539956 [Mercenaria mercenaria]|uniref:uncharacterized protein LOC123539956 n=1 Tax=Mercenaria mercenaria TaxID=6596 RepID=UPI00234F677B|nr:uncharacterized protein LOC123539956 [Mercenaria mercenaria]
MGQLLPLAYCLLTRKTRAIYTQMFLSLKDQAEKRGFSVCVTRLRVDFEDACIKAFTDVFPEARVECCFFHLCQAHWRKIVDLGLRTQYIADEHLALSLRMFTALAFVPVEHVYHVFAELCETVPDAAHAIIPYMEETYVGGYRSESSTKPDGSLVLKRQWREPTYPVGLWNVHERTLAGEPRTNNQHEGWHRRFKTIVDKHHPNIFLFIDKLRSEQSRTETQVEKLIGGQKPVKLFPAQQQTCICHKPGLSSKSVSKVTRT